jgi:trk system potassium uptake protein
MKIIIVGCGRVGAELARRLSLDQHQVSVIDREPEAFERLGSAFRGDRVIGMALDRRVLVEAGAERADAAAAVTGADEVNAVVARALSQQFEVPRVVARMHDPAAAELYRSLGVSTVVPAVWEVGRLAELLVLVDVAAIAAIGSGEVDLIEAVMPPLLDDSEVRELEVSGLIRAAAITRTGHTFVPEPATRLRTGDVVALAVAGGGAERLETLLGRRGR